MSGRRGFTLVELTVALTLAVAVVAIGYGAVEFVSVRDRAGSSRAEDVARQAATRRELARWLASARVLPGAEGPPFQGTDASFESQPDDELSFLTTAPTSMDRRYTIVRLFIDRDSATTERGLVAELRPWPSAGRERLELEPSITALDVSYVTGSYADPRRLRSWFSASLLPATVELSFGGEADSLGLLFHVPLIMTLGGAR